MASNELEELRLLDTIEDCERRLARQTSIENGRRFRMLATWACAVLSAIVMPFWPVTLLVMLVSAGAAAWFTREWTIARDDKAIGRLEDELRSAQRAHRNWLITHG